MKKISTAHWLLVSIVVLQFVISLGLAAAIRFLPVTIPVWAVLLISQVSLILPLTLYCAITRSNPLTLIRFKKTKPVNVIMALLVMTLSYPVIILLNFISMLFVDNAMASVLPSALNLGLIPAVILMALLPAIIEESVFRGSLYNTYSLRRPLAGVFFSAFLFGLMHMNFNQMPYAFFLGIIMALMLEATDSIITTMIMHFSLNGFTTVLSFFTAQSGVSTQAGANFKETLLETYRETLAAQDFSGLSPEEIDAMAENMLPMALGIVIGILAVIAIAALAAVLALIYATFRINGRRPGEVLLAKHVENDYVQGFHGKMRKNAMLDLPVILFIIYGLEECIRSAVMM
ncbi:type II CAAX endopeptidase family protein [Catenibacillus scindens]|uniref:CPBP family intramembrane glutamic endopeptidase n=1 Tax=Catenibacillus scindens TaxID=673271 RepID=UPI00320B9154